MNSLLFGLCVIMATFQLSYQHCPSEIFDPSLASCRLFNEYLDSVTNNFLLLPIQQ